MRQQEVTIKQSKFASFYAYHFTATISTTSKLNSEVTDGSLRTMRQQEVAIKREGDNQTLPVNL
jgi:hypothetical protein